MQKGKSMQYAMAGVQMAPGVHMNVRSNVQIPDAEAGAQYDVGRHPYQAGQGSFQKKEPATLPYRVAIPFLMILFLLFSGLIAGKLIHRVQLNDEYKKTETHLAELNEKNAELQMEVNTNRSRAAISYKAQSYGLIPVDGVNAVMIVAPDTRPNQETNVLTGSSPLSDGHGFISGSR